MGTSISRGSIIQPLSECRDGERLTHENCQVGMRVRKDSYEYDPDISGLDGVVRNYYKDPVKKDGDWKPVFLDIEWGQPPSEWSHYSLNGLVINEH
jgi:hypothetical protein